MNPKIIEILPNKVNICHHQFVNPKQLCYTCLLRNEVIDEVTEVLEKHEVCLCPRTTELNILLQRLAQSDCGSNSCLFAGRGKGGMRTNGGCHCYKDTSEAIRKLILEG